MKVGIIGTGAMGKPIAHNILKKAGYSLIVYARHPEKVKDLEAEGAKIVASPADVGQESDCIVLSLPFDPEVEEVVMGERGILSGALPGTLILDTTTGTPKAAVRVAAVTARKGVGYLDAPISGGVKGAIEARLTFIVGGEKEAVEKAMPLMKQLGTNVYNVGPAGTGRAVKALNQILSKCAANSYHLQTKLPQFIIPGKFDGGHRIEMMVKDLEIALQVAKELNTSAMLTGLATQMYRAGASAGYAKNDISAMVNFLGSFVDLNFSGG